ncbi:hypothetical protein LINPERPRIM_LOCUS31249, partial [Linum perenne]
KGGCTIVQCRRRKRERNGEGGVGGLFEKGSRNTLIHSNGGGGSQFMGRDEAAVAEVDSREVGAHVRRRRWELNVPWSWKLVPIIQGRRRRETVHPLKKFNHRLASFRNLCKLEIQAYFPH